MSEELAQADANLTALADLHRALSAAYEAAFPGQVAETPRAAIGALVLEIGRLRDEGKRQKAKGKRDEADAAALSAAARAFVRSAEGEGPIELPDATFAALLALGDLLDAEHPGAALLAELEAARAERDYWRVQAQDTLTDLHEQAVELDAAQALADVVRAFLQRETAYLPIEKADTLALGRVLDALRGYDEAVKARSE